MVKRIKENRENLYRVYAKTFDDKTEIREVYAQSKQDAIEKVGNMLIADGVDCITSYFVLSDIIYDYYDIKDNLDLDMAIDEYAEENDLICFDGDKYIKVDKVELVR